MGPLRSFKEIGRDLGISETAARVHCYNAIKKIRVLLQKDDRLHSIMRDFYEALTAPDLDGSPVLEEFLLTLDQNSDIIGDIEYEDEPTDESLLEQDEWLSKNLPPDEYSRIFTDSEM